MPEKLARITIAIKDDAIAGALARVATALTDKRPVMDDMGAGLAVTLQAVCGDTEFYSDGGRAWNMPEEHEYGSENGPLKGTCWVLQAALS